MFRRRCPTSVLNKRLRDLSISTAGLIQKSNPARAGRGLSSAVRTSGGLTLPKAGQPASFGISLSNTQLFCSATLPTIRPSDICLRVYTHASAGLAGRSMRSIAARTKRLSHAGGREGFDRSLIRRRPIAPLCGIRCALGRNVRMTRWCGNSESSNSLERDRESSKHTNAVRWRRWSEATTARICSRTPCPLRLPNGCASSTNISDTGRLFPVLMNRSRVTCVPVG